MLNKTMLLGYNANYEFGSLICVRPARKDMTKDNIFKLTLALYRVTALFPKKEPLKFSLRQKALKIFSSLSISKGSAELLSSAEKANILKNNILYIDSIRSLFELAKKQEWIDNRNFSILEAEYGRLDQVLRARYSQMTEPLALAAGSVFKQSSETDRQPAAIMDLAEEEQRGDVEIKRDFFEKKDGVSLLEKKILEALKGKGRMKSGQLREVLPDLNRRSILRKLNELKDKKMVDTSGTGPNTFYFHKS